CSCRDRPPFNQEHQEQRAMAALLHDALRTYLTKHCTSHNRDLIERILPAWPFEAQINVRQIGTPLEEGRRFYDGHEFGPIRFPYTAATDPDWSLRYVGFPLELLASDIGSTGLTFSGSLYVAADIDTLFGHSQGVSDSRIEEIDHLIAPVPYVE